MPSAPCRSRRPAAPAVRQLRRCSAISCRPTASRRARRQAAISGVLLPARYPGAGDAAPKVAEALPAPPPSVAPSGDGGADRCRAAPSAPATGRCSTGHLSGDRFCAARPDQPGQCRAAPAGLHHFARRAGSFQSSPLIYDGIGFIASTYGVCAFDPATCERKWDYTYSPQRARGHPDQPRHRDYDGKLFRGTPDGHLHGDRRDDRQAAVGRPGRRRRTPATASARRRSPMTARSSSAWPAAIWAQRPCLRLRRRHRPAALDLRRHRRSRAGTSWARAEHGGGGTWTTFALDPDKRLLFVPIGNPAPDYYAGGGRATISTPIPIVALDIRHRQARLVRPAARRTTIHDWDTAAAPILYESDGQRLYGGRNQGRLALHLRPRHATSWSPAPTSCRASTRRCPSPTRRRASAPASRRRRMERPGLSTETRLDLRQLGRLVRDRMARAAEGYKPRQLYFGADFAYRPAREVAAGPMRSMPPPARPLGPRGAQADGRRVTPTAGGIVFTGGGDGISWRSTPKDRPRSTASTPAARSAAASRPTWSTAGNMSRSRPAASACPSLA